MNINEKQLVALLAAFGENDHKQCSTSKDLGQNIVVLDRGFVYVGNVTEDADRITITAAKNIRQWGTKDGLGELRRGPLASTKLDDAGDVVVYKRAVMHFIKCQGF